MLRYTYKNIYIYGNKNKQAIGAASTVGRSWESVPPPSRAVLLNLMRTVEKIEKNI